jgi:hypothetical protein
MTKAQTEKGAPATGRHLAYFTPFGAGAGPVRYVLVPAARIRGLQRLETVMEGGEAAHPIYAREAQLMRLQGDQAPMHDVLLRTLRARASEAGHSLPGDLALIGAKEAKS